MNCQNVDDYVLQLVPEVGRWSAETASDNELHCHNTNSPNPDMTPDTYLPKSLDSESQYMVNTQHYLNPDPHYVHKLMKNDHHAKLADNFHEYVDHGSETEEKHHLGDKYLFPYTAEEDHCGTSYPSHQPCSRMMSPAPVLTTNDINNPPDYRMVVGPGSRIGSVMGSVCGGGSVRSSPSPLMPPVVSLMHSQQQLHEPEKDANAETSV